MINTRSSAKFLKIFAVAFIFLVALFVLYNISGKTKKPQKEIPEMATKLTLHDSLVDFSKKYLDTPYVAAGCSEDGFDCSGFVYFVYRNFGVEVPRSSAGFEHFGTEIAIGDIRKGDLLLFLSPTRNAIGHIGIATESKGKATNFIHASSGKEMKVIISSLASEGYKRRFVKAVRVL